MYVFFMILFKIVYLLSKIHRSRLAFATVEHHMDVSMLLLKGKREFFFFASVKSSLEVQTPIFRKEALQILK